MFLLRIRNPFAVLWLGGGSLENFKNIEELQARGDLVEGYGGCIVTSHRIAVDHLNSKNLKHFGPSDFLPESIGKIYKKISHSAYLDPFEAPSMVGREDPDHKAIRKTIAVELSTRAVNDMRPKIEKITKDLVDSFSEKSHIELIEDFCRPLSLAVVSELLGVPCSELQTIRNEIESTVRLIDVGIPLIDYRELVKNSHTIERWVSDCLRSRQDDVVGDGLIFNLLEKNQNGDTPFEGSEMRLLIALLITAGFTTTVSTIGTGFQFLTAHQDQLDLLREQPKLWRNATDEILRLGGPVLSINRQSVSPLELCGKTLPAKTPIHFVGVNTDESVFEHPTKFDVTRKNARQHLAFGAGKHICPGAALARIEIEIALKLLFKQFPYAKLSQKPISSPNLFVRGWESIPVDLGAKYE